MKKIKKFLLLLIAFSFTLLMFNSQAYAVEYYSFEVTFTYDLIEDEWYYSPSNIMSDIFDFVLDNYNSYDEINDYLIYTPLNEDFALFILEGNNEVYIQDNINSFLVFTGLDQVGNILSIDDGLPLEQTYIYTTDVLITFTQTFWDNIIDAIDEAATALSSAASAGVGLIYDGVGLTALGSALVIPIGLGLVLGVFYLIIRMLPSVRL